LARNSEYPKQDQEMASLMRNRLATQFLLAKEQAWDMAPEVVKELNARVRTLQTE